MPMLVTNDGPEPVYASNGKHLAVGQSTVVDGDVTFRTKRGTSDLRYADLTPEEAARIRAELDAPGRWLG